MLEFHDAESADLTVACMEVPLAQARQFGVMAADENSRVIQFEEKSDDPPSIPGDPEHALASMGIYVFSIDLLLSEMEADHLREDSNHDFGMDIIPGLISRAGVFAYRFGGEAGRVSPDRYWRDVGTLDSFYEANMDLLNPVPSLNLYQADWPIRTYQAQYPPARTVPGKSGTEGIVLNSIVAGGALVMGGGVDHSILFPNVTIEDGAVIRDSILFSNVRVGKKACLDKCIIDKDVIVPPGEIIGADPERDAARFTISEQGVVVIPKGYKFD